MATYDPEAGFARSIHSLENSYFRTKFEPTLSRFKGNAGIGVISDNDSQPIVVNSRLGKFAIVTVAKIANMAELEEKLLSDGMHFAELSSGGNTNPSELIATIIASGETMTEGILKVQEMVKGSVSMLILTPDGIIAARDKWGRTPIVIGRKDTGYAAVSETASLPNLDFEEVRDLGPGEIVKITANGLEVLSPARKESQICSFLWVYYGFPVSTYEKRMWRRCVLTPDT